jgi:hypothetical protein
MAWNARHIADQGSGGNGSSGGMKPGAGGKPQGYDSSGRYIGPRGGSVSLRDGSIRLYADADKQAGADSEAGRRGPKSLLSATAEQLEAIATGTGQAVTKGAAGAEQALGRTWQELSTNQELHKGVEFGVKAAGEVSKDVWEKVGEDAASATIGFGAATKASTLFGTDPVTSILRNRGWKLANDGYDLFDSTATKTRELGTRINNVKREK